MEERVAIVTGAAKGIGKAIAKRFREENFFVVIVDIDKENGHRLAKEFGKEYSIFIKCDITKNTDVKRTISFVVEQKNQIDVLVNNAGVIKDNFIWKMPEEDYDLVLNVNLKGTWLMCKEVSYFMKQQNSGRIENIAPRAWLGNLGQSNYSASKGGVISLTRVLALELARYNVNVNAVAPGLIDTPLTQNLPEDVLQNLIEAQPTKKMGMPEDIAHAVFFLVSNKANFITGQVLYVDGGKNIGSNLI